MMLDIRVKTRSGDILKSIEYEDLGGGHYRFESDTGIVVDTYQDGKEDSFTTNGRIMIKDGLILIAPA